MQQEYLPRDYIGRTGNACVRRRMSFATFNFRLWPPMTPNTTVHLLVEHRIDANNYYHLLLPAYFGSKRSREDYKALTNPPATLV